ncbi:protein of unknown function [Ekhidna lutea]|uniref:DUF4349 domain-containing protein n=1 Tax=Ekhidna lutea TaxID=447679 RepID=A0A239EFZ2_EKHLU|nr:DUF4349 domain-containing protein [Ekhidna lutea]SNS43557.1 protein of unknown function [Ekhidna lutea]
MKTLTILIIFLMAACGGNEGSNSTMAEMEVPMTMQPAVEEADAASYRKVANTEQDEAEIQKKVIKTGGLSYRVESTKEEYNRLNDMLEKYEAYISSENENKGYDRVNYNVSIKVPPQNFDPMIADITKDKKLDNRWVNTDDVTERYYDLQSRIDNKKKLEERYLEILKQANKITDILEVERNLNQVRSEIESLQGQFKLLSHQINFSTIDVSFYQLIPYELDQEQRPGFGTRLVNSITAGWQGFLTFLVYVLALWPFGLLAVGVVWVVKKVRARKK